MTMDTEPEEVNRNKVYNKTPAYFMTLPTNCYETTSDDTDERNNGHCPNSELSLNYLGKQGKDSLGDIQIGDETTKKEELNTSEHGPSPSNSEKGHCGIYYGIKSYLHHFYGPPDKEVLKSGDFVQGDDFRFLAEPRRKQDCCIRVGLWVGINLILLGGIAMLVGYLTPPRQAIVGQIQEYTILDRWAVNFNYHLMLCQLVGLATFSFGVIIVVCSLLVVNCQTPAPPPAYLVMGATVVATPSDKHPPNAPTWGIHCIPLSGTIKGVQPSFITQY